MARAEPCLQVLVVERPSFSVIFGCIMSRPKESERNYELVDVDVSIVSLLDYAAETTNILATDDSRHPPTQLTGEVMDGTNTWRSFHMQPAAEPPEVARTDPVHPTLPGGAVITGKNTLQSLDAMGGIQQRAPTNPPLDLVDPTLPDGAVITGKNTLQSFSVKGVIQQQASMDTPFDPADEAEEAALDESPNTTITMTATNQTAVAIAVDADIVYGEVDPDPLLFAPTTAWYKSRSTLALFTFISILLAVVLGLSIGLSNNNDSSKNIIDLPSNAPIAAVPINSQNVIDHNITRRAEVLTSYIQNITLANQKISPNGTSSESKALYWMIYNDTTFNTSLVISEDDPISRNSIGFHIQQRYPLLVMWFQQTESIKWKNITEWLTNPNECYWLGITCQNIRIYYDKNDTVGGNESAITKISFDVVGSYVGTIPIDIGLLTNLEQFKIINTYGDIVNGRYLHGTLPESIGSWTAMTHFDVSYNLLQGALPNSIGRWTSLNYFNISYNYNLNGTLPDSVGEWTKLTSFDVVNNVLTGTLPDSIGHWTALTHFAAGLNYGLNGTLPEIIFEWTALSYFDVGVNRLTGTLSDKIGQWTALTEILIGGNFYLTGILPDSIGNWTALKNFAAFYSALNGTLPDSIGKWTSLTYFDVSYNYGLTGTLPQIMGQWTNLTYFDVTNNNFNGTIPSSIGNWSFINRASFWGNQLVGTIPQTICQWIDPNSDLLQVDCTVMCTCCTVDCV
jgi:hypothetical protein